MQKALFEQPKLIRFVPRDYQQESHDKAFTYWDTGERGVLVRLFTGGGKTPTACLIAGTWLARGDDYRVMIVSYEKQLVWQFAQEVKDFLGIEPGIEMENERAKKADKIVVASRASLLLAPELTNQQRDYLEEHGITDFGPLWKSRAESYLKLLSKRRATAEQIRDQIELLKQEPEAHGDKWSRLHRFSPDYNWLLVFDEAHRHVRKLRSIGYLTEWFWQNPDTKQLGLTATPKRADGVSIGSEMFPCVAADYPLFHRKNRCAVKDGYAVPYIQRYISVEGVDFKSIKKVAGDFDDADLERVLGAEATLAKLCQPLLDLVGDRRTLIFSPGVDMAANVARFINARCEAACPSCTSVAWYPKLLLGDGAQCGECGSMISAEHVTKGGEQARSIHGGTRLADRTEVYAGHQNGQFQFLSVCGLCREGYNDPDIACIAVFRPVSKAASSLAEQMKGRGCRPARAIIQALCLLKTSDERCSLIAESEKPNCLIVDLVGVTGLGDCASTALIYAEGEEDYIVDRAQEILEEEGGDVEEALERAEREDEEEKDRIKQEQLEAERKAKEDFERRAKANADVQYTSHEVGHGAGGGGRDPREATDKQYHFIETLGVRIVGYALTKKQAGRLIDKLLSGESREDATYSTGIEDEYWEPAGPTSKQVRFAAWKGINISWCQSSSDATLAISARMNPAEFRQKMTQMLLDAKTDAALTAAGKKLARCGRAHDAHLVALGKRRRLELQSDEGF